MGQGLHGFAEPHIVGENAAELVVAQKLQPVESVALIGTQLGLQARPAARPWRSPANPDSRSRQRPQPLAAEPAQPDRCFESGKTDRFAGRDVELGRFPTGFPGDTARPGSTGSLWCGRAARPRAGRRGADAEHRAVMRQRVEPARFPKIAQTRQQPGQHRQQRDALPVDLDAEIEREPPPAAFRDPGRPFATAIDDSVAKAVLDLDPPALALELRQPVMDKARPVVRSLDKAKGDLTTVADTGGLERVQPEFLQPPFALPARRKDRDGVRRSGRPRPSAARAAVFSMSISVPP